MRLYDFRGDFKGLTKEYKGFINENRHLHINIWLQISIHGFNKRIIRVLFFKICIFFEIYGYREEIVGFFMIIYV